MQRITATQRLPQVLRVCKAPRTNTYSRNMSLFGTRNSSPFFGEFSPMFSLLDDYASHVAARNGSSSLAKSLKTFQPKFDVKENKENYELHGELPGIEQKNIQIEFTDPQTLTIKGRTEHHREEGTKPTGLIGEAAEQGKITEGEAENGYHKPSVEDESQEQQVEKASTTTEASTTKNESPSSRYWVSERSVGQFARTFAFPTRIDQEHVKASLRDGILSIVIPKAAAPVSRKIQIE